MVSSSGSSVSCSSSITVANAHCCLIWRLRSVVIPFEKVNVVSLQTVSIVDKIVVVSVLVCNNKWSLPLELQFVVLSGEEECHEC